jgi:hypothetical protein
VTVFVEAASAAGYWVEIGALFAFGDVDPRARALGECCIGALRSSAEILAGGTTGGEIAERMRESVAPLGVPTIGFGHGVGIDEDEPHIVPSGEAVLGDPATVALHPSVMATDTPGSVAVANTYQVGRDGAVPLSVWPHEIREV